MRNFAAFAVAELSRNSDVMQMLTDDIGLEAVLYLAQSDDKSIQRQVLQVLTIIRLQPNPAILSSRKKLDGLHEG